MSEVESQLRAVMDVVLPQFEHLQSFNEVPDDVLEAMDLGMAQAKEMFSQLPEDYTWEDKESGEMYEDLLTKLEIASDRIKIERLSRAL